ncbi:MAG: hypothetical protein CL917_03585 [Deltaproteobacteria bacterium]|nr:hypothetical protein [Deltaproteobacteria bacterium]
MKHLDKNRAIVAEAIARSWRDADFKSQFISDPAGTLKNAGAIIDEGHSVNVVENTPSLVHAVLPLHTNQSQHENQIDAALEELRGLPDGMQVRVYRDTDQESFFALPVAPDPGLTDSELEQIAGGKGAHNVTVASLEATMTQSTQTQTVETTTTAAVEAEVGAAVVAAAAVAVAVVVTPCLIS